MNDKCLRKINNICIFVKRYNDNTVRFTITRKSFMRQRIGT